MNIAKWDVVEASGLLQLCAGQKSGSETAIHSMRWIFEDDVTDAVLLIDAFNALNRTAALHNICVLCPIIAVYAINTHRHSARLFITGSKGITSAEGLTQGDPLTMALCALSIEPLLTSLHAMSDAKQCWFADMLVEPALSLRSSNGGTVSIHSVQTLVTFQMLKSAGLLQSQKRRHLSEKIQSSRWQ